MKSNHMAHREMITNGKRWILLMEMEGWFREMGGDELEVEYEQLKTISQIYCKR